MLANIIDICCFDIIFVTMIFEFYVMTSQMFYAYDHL